VENMSVKVNLYSHEQYDDNGYPENAVKFLEWLAEIINKVPDKYKSDVQIDIDTTSEYGDYYVIMNIYYYREETKQEKEDELKRLETAKNQELARKKDLYDKLKAELGEG
jgi:hypothetical protein